MAESDIYTAPIMHTFPSGVLVQRPEVVAQPAKVGKHGGFSIGAEHLPSVGPVVHVAVHHPEGETLLMTMGVVAYNAFARMFNEAGDAIQRGEFNKPERPQ